MPVEKLFCEKCKLTMNETEFYTSYNTERFPPKGKLHQCKKCITMMVDPWEEDTYIDILEMLDMPYIKNKWNQVIKNCMEASKEPDHAITGTQVMGRYLSMMRLSQWRKYRWSDNEKIREERAAEIRSSMEGAGFSEPDILKAIAEDEIPVLPPKKLKSVLGIRVGSEEEGDSDQPAAADPSSFVSPIEVEPDIAEDSLTEEDKTYLKLKWGRGYRWDEMVHMEQMYEDMMASYDIQSAGHKDYLILICKTSLKCNQLIDAGDIDGYQKMSRVYDQLMKSSKFTAAQNNDNDGNEIDSFGRLFEIAEAEGFIPRYYVEGPQDKVDSTLQDLQSYTRSLVMDEMNLGDMLESAIKKIKSDEEKEAEIDTQTEEDLFTEEIDHISEKDYVEFQDFQEGLEEEDFSFLESEGDYPK